MTPVQILDFSIRAFISQKFLFVVYSATYHYIACFHPYFVEELKMPSSLATLLE